MNNLTVFLSQIIGPLLIILGLALILNKSYYVSWFKRIGKESEAFHFITSLIEFVAGMAIVLQHNLWGSIPEVIISVVGWAMILEGALILLIGRSYEKLALKAFRNAMGKIAIVSAIICILLGVYMTWFSYIA